MVIMVRMMTPTQTARENEMRTKTLMCQKEIEEVSHFVKCGAADMPTLVISQNGCFCLRADMEHCGTDGLHNDLWRIFHSQITRGHFS